MTWLAIGMPFIHSETDVIVIISSERSIALKTSIKGISWCPGWEEWIAALCTEEVLLVICPLA